MKIKLYRSATVGLISDDFRLLQDPWLNDGEYYGSWYHYPPFDIDKNLEELNKYHAIYISHIHPDHCAEGTLKRLNKNIPIYIHKYHSRFLKNKIERLGFSVIELENNKRTEIGKNFSLRIIAADNCDPALCYKFTGCANFLNPNEGSQQIDTLAFIEDSESKIINVNDCPLDLAKNTVKKVMNKKDIYDCLLTGYGGAGPYPQCFDNLSNEEKLSEANIKKINFLNKAFEYIDILRPKYYLPFAGRYTLSGSLKKLNKFRGLPNIDEAYDYLDLKIKKNNLTTRPIKINADSYFDLGKGKPEKEYVKYSDKDYQSFIKNLTDKKFNYQIDSSDFNEDDIIKLAFNAFEKLKKKILDLNIKIKNNVLLDFKSDNIIKIDMGNKNINVISREDLRNLDNYVLYKLDRRLLYNLLKGPRYAHWNNAEIGSHISFYRKPNYFDRNVHLAMCYFHN